METSTLLPWVVSKNTRLKFTNFPAACLAGAALLGALEARGQDGTGRLQTSGWLGNTSYSSYDGLNLVNGTNGTRVTIDAYYNPKTPNTVPAYGEVYIDPNGYLNITLTTGAQSRTYRSAGVEIDLSSNGELDIISQSPWGNPPSAGGVNVVAYYNQGIGTSLTNLSLPSNPNKFSQGAAANNALADGLFFGVDSVSLLQSASVSLGYTSTNTMLLQWSGSVLLQSPNLNGPWATNSAAVSPMIIDLKSAPRMYYKSVAF